MLIAPLLYTQVHCWPKPSWPYPVCPFISRHSTGGRLLIWSINKRWNKYFVISVFLHLALLSIPVSMVARQGASPIDVSLIAQNDPPPRTETTKTLSSPKPERPKRVLIDERPPPAQRPEEPKDVKAQVVSPGEQTVMKVAPGSGDTATGVAVAGAKIGTGGTEVGGSMPGGAGTGKDFGYGGEGKGPIDAQFGSRNGPRFAYQEVPEYPYVARRQGKEGRVLVQITIDEKGRLIKLDVIEASDRVFVDAATEAIRKSRFLPARQNGVPYASRAMYPVRFVLK